VGPTRQREKRGRERRRAGRRAPTGGPQLPAREERGKARGVVGLGKTGQRAAHAGENRGKKREGPREEMGQGKRSP
jgi:phosphoglycerate dehydrogenase-like enzyme